MLQIFPNFCMLFMGGRDIHNFFGNGCVRNKVK